MCEQTRAGLIEALGHLAVWAGLYNAGVVAAAAALTGVHPGPAVLIGSLCIGTGVYQLDRVKLRDAWIDAADRAAHPRRAAFLFDRRRGVRAGALLLIAAGSALLFAWHPLAALLGPAAVLGVIAYAGLPRRVYRALGTPRPKDILIVKNAGVALSITLFAGALIAPSVWGDWTRLAWGVLGVLPHVFADAVLCDLDDLGADGRFGTGTIPVRAGRAPAWTVAWVICVAMPLVGVLAPPGEQRSAWLAFHGLMLGSLGVLDVAQPRRVRDLIDLRLPICAAIVMSAVL